MALRRARERDHERVADMLEGVLRDRIRNPDALRRFARQKGSFLWLDDEAGTTCAVRVNASARQVSVFWLGPLGRAIEDYQAVVFAALEDAHESMPEAREWEGVAKFTALPARDRRAACELWVRRYMPGFVVEEYEPGKWQARGSLAEAKRWIDDARP